MPRPERPLDPLAGPIQAFAAELRKLREDAGSPKYQQMAVRTGRSRTALTEAAGGNHLATWETVEAYVRACNGDLAWWRTRYDQVRAALDDDQARRGLPEVDGGLRPSAPHPLQWDSSAPLSKPGPAAPHWRRRRTAWVAGATTVAAGIAVVAVASSPTPSRHASAVLEIQNKVAIGSTALVEDKTPAYLSARPQAYCSHRGCKIPNTDLWSGALVVATCYLYGEQMTNADLGSSGIAHNRGRWSSRRWYRVTLQPQGVTGYIAEVYVIPADRGGMGLPRCR